MLLIMTLSFSALSKFLSSIHVGGTVKVYDSTNNGLVQSYEAILLTKTRCYVLVLHVSCFDVLQGSVGHVTWLSAFLTSCEALLDTFHQITVRTVHICLHTHVHTYLHRYACKHHTCLALCHSGLQEVESTWHLLCTETGCHHNKSQLLFAFC